jgi:glucose/arabinose dehydrogenase
MGTQIYIFSEGKNDFTVNRIVLFLCILLTACQAAEDVPISFTPTATPIQAVATVTQVSPSIFTETPTPVPTIPVSVVELDGAEIQPGFSLIKFADLPRSTAIAFDSAGRMFVTSQDGNVYLLTDENGDGRADDSSIFASGYTFALGIAIHESTGDIYVSHQGVISVLRDDNGDNVADGERIFAGDLPFGLHQNDNLEFGPDGFLYIGVGSTCDACDDTNPQSATILRFNVATGEREILATGMRNPFDIAFHPDTGDMFATDNGRDKLGMDTPLEELNHIIPGGDYGYPDCWDAGDQPGCENSIPAVAFFEAHSSANGLEFYQGNNFPVEYRGNAFVTIFGSWLKAGVQTGIQRVILTRQGNSYRGETSWFIKFPQGVMPLPIELGPDEMLYVGDYINGVIYRISYGTP